MREADKNKGNDDLRRDLQTGEYGVPEAPPRGQKADPKAGLADANRDQSKTDE